MKPKHKKMSTLAATLIAFGSLSGGADGAAIMFTFASSDADFTYNGTTYIGQDLSMSVTYDTANYLPAGGPNGGDQYVGAIGVYSSSAAGIANQMGTVPLSVEFGLPGSGLPEFVQLGPDNATFTGWVFDMPAGVISTYDGVSNLSSSDNGAISNGNGIVFTDVVGGLDLVSDGASDGGSDFTITQGVGSISFDAVLVPEPSSALLFGLAAVGFVARRRRK